MYTMQNYFEMIIEADPYKNSPLTQQIYISMNNRTKVNFSLLLHNIIQIYPAYTSHQMKCYVFVCRWLSHDLGLYIPVHTYIYFKATDYICI